MTTASLLFRLVRSDGQETVLTDKLLLGRSPECSLPVEDDLASRQHAQLEVIDQKVILTDLKSRNGTWVNEKQVMTPVELHEGDQIRIGNTIFVFHIRKVAPEATVSPAPDVPTANETMAWDIAIPLTLVRGDGAEFGLNRTMRLGRRENNDVVLKGDASVSQTHAVIELVNGQAFISDQASNNGTWVNGKRIAERTSLKHGDKIRLGNTIFRLRVGDRALPSLDPATQASKSSRWPGCIALFISLMAVTLVVMGLAFPPLVRYLFATPTATPINPNVSVALEATQSAARQDALRALVMVEVPVYTGSFNDWDGKSATGSGTLLSNEGIVLTNFHVIGDLETGTYHNPDGLVFVELNRNNPEANPNEFYRVEIAKTDPSLDLAVLRVVEVFNSGTESFERLTDDVSFTSVRLGNSDDLRPQDRIYVWGYPGVGENTPTMTDGIVSGFLFLPNNSREWIKTNTEISEGNSGGMALNAKAELIGVPTWGNTSGSGGRINYIRPINLALDLIRSVCPGCVP